MRPPGSPDPLALPSPGRRKLGPVVRGMPGPGGSPVPVSGRSCCVQASPVLGQVPLWPLVALLSCRFPLHPRAGVTFRGCCEYFHLLPPTCRNLSLECFGVAGGGAASRPGAEHCHPGGFLGCALLEWGAQVPSRPRLPGRWLFVSPETPKIIQCGSKHAAPHSQPLAAGGSHGSVPVNDPHS